MLKKRELVKNISIAFVAQGVAMLVSVAQTLIVPKILGVEQFAYWQLFIFYIGYVGFFHFGLCSGVYLKMGGKTKEEFDKGSTKSQFIFGLSYQAIMAAVIVVVSFGLEDGQRSFVFMQTAMYLVLANACTYLMNVMQCMNEIKESSFSMVLGRLSYFVPLMIMIMLGVKNFEPYVVAYTGSMSVQLVYCLWKLRDFVSAPWIGLRRAARESLSSIKVGINLTIANIASTLILGVSRFFIDVIWGIEAFGKLSLMFSIVSFSLLFVNQAGIVLFPALRKCDDSESATFYASLRSFLGLALPLIYLLYFPLKLFFSAWLPAYADALPYLALLLPICVFDGMMSVTGNTYLQVYRKERLLSKINIIAALISTAISAIGGFYLDSIQVVLLGPSMAIAIRSIYSEGVISKQLHLRFNVYAVWMVLLTCVFILMVNVFDDGIAFLVFAILYAIYLLIHSETAIRVVNQIRNVFK